MHTTTLRILAIMLAGLWLTACSSNEEAPKAKSASKGDALSADGGTNADDALPAKADVEKNDSTTPSSANEDDGKSGKDSKKSEADDENLDDEDGDDDGSDEDDSSSKKGSALSFKSTSRDDNDYSLAIKVGKSDWQRKEWPAKGESVEFAGVCKGKKVEIQIKVVSEDGKEFTKGKQLKVEASGKTAKVAFEESAEGGADDGDEGSPDDLVGEINCSNAKLAIK